MHFQVFLMNLLYYHSYLWAHTMMMEGRLYWSMCHYLNENGIMLTVWSAPSHWVWWYLWFLLAHLYITSVATSICLFACQQLVGLCSNSNSAVWISLNFDTPILEARVSQKFENLSYCSWWLNVSTMVPFKAWPVMHISGQTYGAQMLK